MKRIRFIVLALLLLSAMISHTSSHAKQGTKPTGAPDQIVTSPKDITYQLISFDDITPPELTTKACWNALGMDNQERVYIGFTSNRSDGREDFAVFRYDPDSGERLFLGTFINVSQAANNLLPGEEIPKGHTRMIYIDGKMYMGSQGFHDFKKSIDDLPKYRGSHLYAYNLSSGKWKDISKTFPDGVITKHQGIIALSYTPAFNLLIGLTHPHSDIVLFNYQENKVLKVVPGIPWQFGNPLSRQIVITPKGKIYTYRGTEEPVQRNEIHNIWVYDLKTEKMKKTNYSCTGGFWNGQTLTRDGSKIYISTVQGELYVLDVETEVFTHLGHFLPRQDYKSGKRITYFYGSITLSPDEKKIYGIPSLITDVRRKRKSGILYEYDILTGKVALVKELGRGIYTGSDLRDSRGNIYFAHFGNARKFWKGNPALLVIKAGSK